MPRLVEACLLASVALAVFSFGGAEPVSFAAVEVILFALAALLALVPLKSGFRMSLGAFTVPIALTGIVLLQLCPLPISGMGWKRLSIAPYATLAQFLVLLTCFIAFYAARLLSSERHRRRRLIMWIVAIGSVDAFYGLIEYLSGSQRIFAYAKKYDLEEVTGTYINRNHFAGLMEMVLPFAVALMLHEFGKLPRRSRPRKANRLQAMLGANLYRVIVPVFVTALLCLALIFSRSRMGIMCSGCSLGFMFLLFRFREKVPRTLVASLIVVSLCLILWIGPGPVTQRFGQIAQEYSAAGGTRLSIWRASWSLIREHPWLGTGLGTFPIAFTSVQDSFLGEFVNHAHNDYVELAVDLGIPAAALLVGMIVFILIRSISAFAAAERRFDRLAALAASAAIMAIALHGLADFNLYIPANALVLSIVIGIVPPAQQRTQMQADLPLVDSVQNSELTEVVAAQLTAERVSRQP